MDRRQKNKERHISGVHSSSGKKAVYGIDSAGYD